MNILSIAKKQLKRHRYNACARSFLSLYKRIINTPPHKNYPIRPSEAEWLNKWRKYDKNVSPLSYRIFSSYIGENLDIIPLELCKCIVEPILNPERYNNYYEDKNSYDQLFEEFNRPLTWLRNIKGNNYDRFYRLVVDVDSQINTITSNAIILKPSRASSGHGVRLFKKHNGKFMDSDGNVISSAYLESAYGNNYIIQSCIEQSPYMAHFNESSLNTLRIVTYRSVSTGKINVINSILRIGASGKVVDNAHAGGMFVGVNVNSGQLGKYVCDYLGNVATCFNDIDFSAESYVIPKFDEIKDFAIKVTDKILYQNLVAMDVAIDSIGNPLLLETNTSGFSAWLFQFAVSPAFGEFTDEIFDYCFEQYNKISCETILN